MFAQAIPALDWYAFLLHQVPVVVVLGVICYVLYKDSRAKDIEAREDRKELTALYGKAVEAQTKGNEIQNSLITVIKDLRDDVNKVNETVHNKL